MADKVLKLQELLEKCIDINTEPIHRMFPESIEQEEAELKEIKEVLEQWEWQVTERWNDLRMARELADQEEQDYDREDFERQRYA